MTHHDSQPEETGVADVRRVREAIARLHNGNLAEHIAETNRIVEKLKVELGLGPEISPPTRPAKSGRTG